MGVQQGGVPWDRGGKSKTIRHGGLYGMSRPASVLKKTNHDQNTTTKGPPASPPLPGDIDKNTISLPSRKSSELWQVLADWPHSRRAATCAQIAELTRSLLHVWVTVRPRKGFVQRLLAHASCPSLRLPFFTSERALPVVSSSRP